MTGSFHLAEGSQHSSVLQQVSVLHSFLLLKIIPIFLSVRGICFSPFVSCFYFFAVVAMTLTFVFKFLWTYISYVELLGHMVTLMFTLLRKCQRVFQRGYTILHSHQ